MTNETRWTIFTLTKDPAWLPNPAAVAAEHMAREVDDLWQRVERLRRERDARPADDDTAASVR
jgi:hypothetical protein